MAAASLLRARTAEPCDGTDDRAVRCAYRQRVARMLNATRCSNVEIIS